MKPLIARPICLIACLLAFLATGCSLVEKAKIYAQSFQKKYANPYDACTFLNGHDISVATGDNILSKTKIPRTTPTDSSTSTSAPTTVQYDCSYNLSATVNGYQQGNMEVHVIPTDSYDSLADKGENMMTSTETGNSSNGSVQGFSSNHDTALWNQTENTLYERRNGYAISVKVPFTHSNLSPQDADKDLAKHIFENLPPK